MLQQPRPDRPRRIVFLVLEFDGNDDVRVHGPERHAQLVADLLRQPSVCRSGFSSPTTIAGLTSSAKGSSR